VAELHEGGELVDGEEVPHPIAKLPGHIAGVVAEGLGGVAGLPAAVLVLEGLGEVPVVQGGERLDAVGEQLIDQARVEIQALGVGGAGALGEDARPGVENR
jgi:hypothetical protein